MQNANEWKLYTLHQDLKTGIVVGCSISKVERRNAFSEQVMLVQASRLDYSIRQIVIFDHYRVIFDRIQKAITVPVYRNY